MSTPLGHLIERRERRGSVRVVVGFVALVGVLVAPQAQARVSAAGGPVAGDTYYVHRPASLDRSKPVPLVVACCSGQAMEQQTGWSQQADRSGFVVAYVSPGKVYNDAERQRGPGPAYPDMTFISSVIGDLTKTENIDPARVFVTGGSMGGIVAYRAACYLSDQVAAIGSVAGVDVDPACRPSRAVSVAEIHGTADTAIPYNGKPGFLSAPATVGKWRAADGCSSAKQETTNGKVNTQLWPSCDLRTAVELVTLAGTGHGWPRDSQFDSTATLWRFFAAHAQVARISAQVVGVAVSYGARRTVRIRLRLGQASSVRTRIVKGRRTVLTRTTTAKSGTSRVSIALPSRIRAGTYTLVLAVSADGSQQTLKHALRLKR